MSILSWFSELRWLRDLGWVARLRHRRKRRKELRRFPWYKDYE